MANRVVITGIGPVTSGGSGCAAFEQFLWAGKPVAARRIPACYERHYAFRSKYYAPLPQVDMARAGIEAAWAAIMQPADCLAVAGARQALDDGGFSDRSAIAQCDCIIGTGVGGLEPVFSSWLVHNGIRDLSAVGLAARRIKYNRMIVPQIMTSSTAAWVSICCGLRGASCTISASCASGTCAVGEAFRRIRDGYATTVIAGGVENLAERTGAVMRGFDVLGTLTAANDGVSRPLSAQHDGFLFAEGGACLLLIEELSQAVVRGARIYAEIADYRAMSDAGTIVQMDKDGAQARALLAALCEGQPIDYYNAHGTGTRLNDTVEAQAVAAVFKDGRSPVVNSTKALFGHTLGASGAIEAAATALALYRQKAHGMPVGDPLPGLRLCAATIALPINLAISVSFGFGGHNAGLLLRRYGERGA
jgi:3-oxoacyl-[acyl-carrier-protein] synthase II